VPTILVIPQLTRHQVTQTQAVPLTHNSRYLTTQNQPDTHHFLTPHTHTQPYTSDVHQGLDTLPPPNSTSCGIQGRWSGRLTCTDRHKCTNLSIPTWLPTGCSSQHAGKHVCTMQDAPCHRGKCTSRRGQPHDGWQHAAASQLRVLCSALEVLARDLSCCQPKLRHTRIDVCSITHEKRSKQVQLGIHRTFCFVQKPPRDSFVETCQHLPQRIPGTLQQCTAGARP
jgi:hypothetical protein